MPPPPIRQLRALCVASGLLLVAGLADPRLAQLAAPATPLIANDPYFQTFSPRGSLTDNPTVAGTNGKEQQISAIAFVEGHVCQLIGPAEKGATAAEQLNVTVYPTRTVYEMLCGSSVNLKTPITMTFMTAALPSNLTIMSRPVTYLTFYSPPNKGSANIQIYVDISYQHATVQNSKGPTEVACGSNTTAMDLGYAWLGNAQTQDTPIPCADPLNCREGDNIFWGQLYLANDGDAVVVGAAAALRSKFVSQGWPIQPTDGSSCSTPLSGASMPVLATTLDLNNQNDPGEPLTVVFGYDDDVAIRWWGECPPPQPRPAPHYSINSARRTAGCVRARGMQGPTSRVSGPRTTRASSTCSPPPSTRPTW
jgi:hypothetical protein